MEATDERVCRLSAANQGAQDEDEGVRTGDSARHEESSNWSSGPQDVQCAYYDQAGQEADGTRRQESSRLPLRVSQVTARGAKGAGVYQQ